MTQNIRNSANLDKPEGLVWVEGTIDGHLLLAAMLSAILDVNNYQKPKKRRAMAAILVIAAKMTSNMFKLKIDPNSVDLIFLLQVSLLNGTVMAKISMIFINGCHPRWPTRCSSWRLLKFSNVRFNLTSHGFKWPRIDLDSYLWTIFAELTSIISAAKLDEVKLWNITILGKLGRAGSNTVNHNTSMVGPSRLCTDIFFSILIPQYFHLSWPYLAIILMYLFLTEIFQIDVSKMKTTLRNKKIRELK